MGFIFKKVPSFIGVDVGSSSLKVVELSLSKGAPKLETYGLAEVEVNLNRDTTDESTKQIGRLLARVSKTAKVNSKKAVVSLPNFSVFSSLITLPKLDKKKLAQAVQWEAKKVIPMPVKDIILDWRILPANKGLTSEEVKESKNVEVLLTAAPKSLVRRYLQIIKTAGLEIISLETEGFALPRCLVGPDPSSIILIDVGASATDITVLEQGLPVVTRSIDAGGKIITQQIAQRMNVDQNRAEQFKRDVGLTVDTSNEPNAISTLMDSSFQAVLNEVQYTLDIYKARNKQVDRVVLTGGSSYLTGLPAFFEQKLNIKVLLADPWSRISYPEPLKSVLQEIGPRFSVAIGLALKELKI